MAAKKKTTKKAAKRVVKKAAKKAAKKAVKKPVKKATKKAAPKKAARKVAKKAIKKAVTKKSAKKVSKKAAPKKAAKKVVKKATKKLAKKAVKKAAKKVIKKAAKKAVTPTPRVKKVAKNVVPKKPVVLKGFAKKQHQRLLDLRDGIVDAMYGVTHDQLKNSDGIETGGGGMHTGDAGSDSYDRDFALNLLAKEQDALSEVEKAITRAETGVYGICEISGKRIPNERLEAIPFAKYTVECQAAWEKENGHLRNNGKSEFGFSNGNTR